MSVARYDGAFAEEDHRAQLLEETLDMRKRGIVIGVIATSLLLVGVAIWFWCSGEDAQVEKVKQLQATMFTGNGPPSREQMDEMRKAMDQLTSSQRAEVMRPMRERMEREMETRIDSYFALPQEERAAYLDNEIQRMEQFGKEMEQRRKEFESRRQQTGQDANGNTPGPPPGGPGGPMGGPGGPGGGPGGPPGPMDMTSDAGKTRRNNMLDHLPPTKRAKLDAYFSDVAKRRIALGLPAMPSPPGPPPGGPPR